MAASNSITINSGGCTVNRTAENGKCINGELPSEIPETEYLIVGAGPAGASDEGDYDKFSPGDRKYSTGAYNKHGSFSLAGEEYARIYSWGNDPKRKGDYESASPCSPVDLPQTLLEPVLIRYATIHGFTVRFDTTFLSFTEDLNTGLITTTIEDNLSKLQYKVRTKYLFGADGARSKIVKQLNLPLSIKSGQGLAINVLVKADLSHLIKHRQGNLHWVMQPDRDHPDFGWMGIVRMVKPWYEWMFILFPTPDFNPSTEPSTEQYIKRVKDFIGDDSIPVEILDISRWYINEIVAETYSQGNVFCLGDAVHRHPPMNGLGSNTCIQDAFNLAWKIAYVSRGLAKPSILSTYSTERQPVGHSIITRANQAFRDHSDIWKAVGILPNDLTTRKKLLAEMSSPCPAGIMRRKAFQKAILHTSHEFHGLGIEMGQRYTSAAIYDADEEKQYIPCERVQEDPVLYHDPNTYPGSRLPHVWLNKAIPGNPTSTIDLSGHGNFTLFTGIGGEAWVEAAKSVTEDLGVTVNAYSIGFRQDWEDVYFDWERLRGVEESGAVLVRPDRFVAWRAQKASAGVMECEYKLREVMRHILGYTAARRLVNGV
ncbi:hypothetical protein B7463_g11188, partial [Scytalidium lignicola]